MIDPGARCARPDHLLYGPDCLLDSTHNPVFTATVSVLDRSCPAAFIKLPSTWTARTMLLLLLILCGAREMSALRMPQPTPLQPVNLCHALAHQLDTTPMAVAQCTSCLQCAERSRRGAERAALQRCGRWFCICNVSPT